MTAGDVDQRGAVFIDVLVSMMFVLLLVGTAQTWARAVLFSHKVLEAAATAQEEVSLAAEAVAREIRNAGFNAGISVAPIAAATRESIELSADLNGDGDIDDAHEHLRYAYRADRRQITRASGRGNPQPFVDDVPPDGLRLWFRDENGHEIVSDLAEMNAAELASIRRVDIRVQIELPNPDPRGGGPIFGEAFATVALRNR